jgi:cytochrome P450
MTDTTIDLRAVPQLPFERPDVLNTSPLYKELRQQGPVVRVTTPTGDPAWLVVAYQEARTVFSDRRFGYFVHRDPKKASTVSDAAVNSAPLGGEAFDRDMARLRKLLVPAFAPKRMRLLVDWIQELTDDCLDDMQAARDAHPDQPVNFHALLGWRLPVLVIGAMLDVPDEDRDYVITLSDRMGDLHGGAYAQAAVSELREYMRRLIDVKRKHPAHDVISDMVAAEEADPEFFTERPIEAYAAGLVFPGHETTVARMDFGVLWLLTEPRRKDWVMADPENRIDSTVEEILRMTSAHNLGLLRWALEDVEIGGVTVNEGELVIISESAANRDPAVFPNPDTFDAARDSAPHVAFGHGPHVCLGQSLARTELRIVFPSLFRRFPDIRLAAEVRDLHIRGDRTGGGVDDVPVTW